MNSYISACIALCCFAGISRPAGAQSPKTVFEQSGGRETATYQECISFYSRLAAKSHGIQIKEMGMTDAGYPLHLVMYNADQQFDPAAWDRSNKIVILINNGIHPGEPDGIDASMLLLRDVVAGKVQVPHNVILAIIPIYNVGGALNRNKYSRANQDGPASYGFRGNAQNLDLNRDFTKCDSREARSFTQIFHYLDPDIFIDNHVSDGADYQHVMTLVTTQPDKLGGLTGELVRRRLDPQVYERMRLAKEPICPYVNVEDQTPDQGWTAFYDPPRFGSGYAALFQCIAYVPETHMLKPFKQRVQATYTLLKTIMAEGGVLANEITAARRQDRNLLLQQSEFPLHWSPDTSRFTAYFFKGYTAKYKTSDVTGQQRLYYDHKQPFTQDVQVRDHFVADKFVKAPQAYIIPQGWHAVIELLQLNGVKMLRLANDSVIEVTAYHIDNCETYNRAYEKHYKHHSVRVSKNRQQVKFLKGDYIIPMHQPAKRFLVEMLEPEGDDSYFSWNFFDAVLQQKEYYSDYRWEDVAAAWLKSHPELRRKLEEKKKADADLAKDASAQLRFVYINSPYYEPGHLRYPVYRVE